MSVTKDGDTVKVHYTGKLEDGTIFDTSEEHEPIEFTVGQGKIIPGFEKAVIGMSPGDSKTVELSSEEAYGPHRDNLVMVVEKDELPENIEPQEGQHIQVQQKEGNPFMVQVTDVSGDKVTLDANHPLAGKDLTFEIELVSIE